MYMTDHINSEYTHSAEPSPQVWLGNKKFNDYWQENNCRLYITVIMIIILRL